MTANSTTSKPAKPYPDFPLYPHASGRWAKKIKGRTHFFGKWAEPDRALAKFNQEFPYLSVGRRPPTQAEAGGITVAELCNEYIERQSRLLDAGERSVQTFNESLATGKAMVAVWGRDLLASELRPTDFQKMKQHLGRSCGPVALKNRIGRVKTFFRFGVKQGLIPVLPPFGVEFDPPTAKEVRLARAARGPKYFEPAEVRAMIDEANPTLRAMIMLGINCAFNERDCSLLTTDYLDLAGGWVAYRREKTGEQRKAKLWPETVDAIKAVLKAKTRPRAPAHAKLVFVNRDGGTYQRAETRGKIGSHCPVVTMTNRLLVKLGVKRTGLCFGALRHTFRTEAGRCRDREAIRLIMGHAPDQAGAMDANYTATIHESRLEAVAATVRRWLYE